jgi:hypothetical protein
MSDYICGSLKTANHDESAEIDIAKQINAKASQLEMAIQLAYTRFSKNIPSDFVRKVCIYAASKIEGNLIFNLLTDPLSNLGSELLDDLNPWFGKDPEDAPLMKFMKWLLTSKFLDSAAIYIEDADILIELAEDLDHVIDELNVEEVSAEKFLQYLREFYPREVTEPVEGLFIIQI